MKSKTADILTKFFLTLNILCVAFLLVSAYGGFINPDKFSWLVSATLAFPIAVAVNLLYMVVWLVALSRKWWISLVALLVCVGPLRTYCPVNITEPVPKGSIKVETYNVYGFGGGIGDSVNNELMLDYVRNSDADIFCAQEAYYTGRRIESIEEALAHWKYRDTLVMGASYNGMMLCSNFPIIDRHVIGSPSAAHKCAVYRLKVADGDTIYVINSHFVSNSMNAEDKQAYRDIILSPEEDNAKDDLLRLCRKVNAAGVKRGVQVDSLMDYLDKLGDVPMVMCGDFNDSPLSYVHHRLTTKLRDAYVASGNGPGISYHLSGMFFRLDNVLISHHWRAFDAKVKSRYKMSDHYPLGVTLKRME